MKPNRLVIFASALVICVAAGISVVRYSRAQPAPVSGRSAREIRTQLCASCHGAGWEGARAPSMLDQVWAHGSDTASLTRSIRDGWPENGMPAFGQTLTAPEIQVLVADILESNRRGEKKQASSTLPDQGAVRRTELASYKLQTVVDGLDVPWGLAFLPDGRLLVSERAGRLRVVEIGRGIVDTITGLPRVWERQDGGLFDVALDPDFANNAWIYLSFSEAGGSGFGSSSTRIIRGHLRGNALVDQETLFKPAPEFYWRSNIHYGSRFLFGRDGQLYFSLGDRGHRTDAQLLTSPYGKLHRISPDGKVPADNPFVDRPDAVKSIWSYGHRNQQGLAQHPITGEIWAIEHGPTGGDELNLIVRGHNFGWPVLSYGIWEDGRMPEGTKREGMDDPVEHWEPPFAPGALAFYTGDQFPPWKNQLFVGALAGQQLRRLEVNGHKVVHEETIFDDQGRVRSIVVGPDGFIYLGVNTGWGRTGKVLRMVPASDR